MGGGGSVLHRDAAVLVVVDIQERLAVTMGRRDKVIAATALALRAAAIVGVPVISTRQYPRGLGETEVEVLGVLAEAGRVVPVTTVDKVSFDCFGEPEFEAALQATGRSQLVLCGMETHICICQTALAGLARGLDVHVVADACCSRDDENRSLALGRLQAAGAVITSSESAAYELVGAAGTPEFKALLAAVKG